MTPEERTAYDFVDSIVNRADGKLGGYVPFWHGWALREAYVAGYRAALEAEREACALTAARTANAGKEKYAEAGHAAVPMLARDIVDAIRARGPR